MILETGQTIVGEADAGPGPDATPAEIFNYWNDRRPVPWGHPKPPNIDIMGIDKAEPQEEILWQKDIGDVRAWTG